MYKILHDGDWMSRQYSITVVKEGNDDMANVISNDRKYERKGGTIDGEFSTHMKDPVIMMHLSES